MRPALKAELVLGGAVLAHLAVVETMFFTAGAGRNDVLTVAKFFGLHVAAVMMVQLVLVARLPWLDRRLGMDRLTAWHRWTGIALAWTIACHATFVLLGFARLNDDAVPETFLSLAGVTASLLGMCAAAIVVVGGGRLHPVGPAAAAVRGLPRRPPAPLRRDRARARPPGAGRHHLRRPARHRLLVDDVGAGPRLASRVPGRRADPRATCATSFRVAAVVPESDDVVSVHVTGRDLHRLPGRAGQFCIWRFPGHFGWWQANPFSLSAAPDGRACA